MAEKGGVRAMCADDFRRIALGLEHSSEGAHMGHPDFRVNGRIFATLHHDDLHGMVKLTPEQQQTFVLAHRAAFVPENGAWGRQGCTSVRLDAIDEDTLGVAMTLAWRNASSMPAARRSTPSRRARRPRTPRTR
ncbi:MAG: MmcQ/YjbR family DNA-binding protein [Acidobacteriota bacterium]